MPPAASPGRCLQRRKGGGVCTFAKSFKAIVESQEAPEATPDCTNFSWGPLQGKSWNHISIVGAPGEKAEPGPLASDAEMLDLDPACLVNRDGTVSGCRCPAPGAREMKESP